MSRTAEAVSLKIIKTSGSDTTLSSEVIFPSRKVKVRPKASPRTLIRALNCFSFNRRLNEGIKSRLPWSMTPIPISMVSNNQSDTRSERVNIRSTRNEIIVVT